MAAMKRYKRHFFSSKAKKKITYNKLPLNPTKKKNLQWKIFNNFFLTSLFGFVSSCGNKSCIKHSTDFNFGFLQNQD